jgi:hypothetical protein
MRVSAERKRDMLNAVLKGKCDRTVQAKKLLFQQAFLRFEIPPIEWAL